jgi:hypothetical protein
MGISLRCYARHRGVTLAAVQKARQTGRIPILADGTVDATAADTAWDAAAAARRITEKVPADPTRVKLPAGALAAAQETVRATLAQQGVGAGALILGFTMIGAEAGEVVAVVQTAMLADLPYPKLRDAILAHPTMAEGLGPLFSNVPARSVRQVIPQPAASA